MLSFSAVLLGCLVAGVIADSAQYQTFIVALTLTTVATLGYFTSRPLKSKKIAGSVMDKNTINPVKFFVRNYRMAKINKGVNLSVIGLGVFCIFLMEDYLLICPCSLLLVKVFS